MRRRQALEAECYRAVRRLAREHAGEIERRFPKVLRRVGGYNLDEFVGSDRPFNLAKLMVGSEGTLGVVLEAKLNLVPLPAAKAVLAIQFADLLEALAATPLILRHRPSAVEVMDRFILDHTRQSAQLDALRKSFIEGDPGALLCVEFYGDRAGGSAAAAARRSSEICAARGLGYRYHHALDLPGTGAHLEPARSRARPVDGDEGRRQVALLRRGHRRGAREAARLHRTVSRSSFSATARRRACTRTPRSAACTSGRSST